MSIVTCKVCKREVIETADRCPHCNSLGPKKSKRVMWIMIGVVIVLAIVMGLMIYKKTQEKVRTRAEIDEARRSEKIHQRIMSASFLLKTNEADPASVQIDDIKTNIDGSVLCYHYSLKDETGKLTKKRAVFAEGDIHYSRGSWDIYCQAKNLMEVPDKPPPID